MGLPRREPSTVTSKLHTNDQHFLYYTSKFFEEFTISNILGVGSYGLVFRTENKLDGLQYAVKRISVESNLGTRTNAFSEATAMQQLDHPSIVKYKTSWIETPPILWQMTEDLEMLKRFQRSAMPTYHRCDQTATFIYIQMELCSYTLSDWLNLRHTDPQIRPWFRQITSAVEYIHEKGFIHRDLKPSNILFSTPDTVKICDLGLATERKLEFGNELTGTYTIIGSPLYMAPEQANTLNFTEYFVMRNSLANRMEIFNNYRSGKPNNILWNQPKTKEFITLLTNVDPKKRSTSTEMLQHKFLN
uniref:Protein kinase domain-containing protein n=1 Tax=Pristionchus pacificus TaxID=54126 RepID=A0A2A6CVQ0_PRIPA|eukprot:PDM82180.1 protein kinase [Pristionchus pacificus]